ncbi:MAG: putative DNA binding domain-containing protein [Gammaproteobacteria bacterium]|nr:putative DNA binding domain-containing protein [Gammaproteobacteria bacterium]MBU1647391.1 putative DNA binding domain-containing protein [Gammaproteobacteria bacterium]MBU1973183.1 putative DNA binding domain-containing protein [Gammaproteobacteria bacterium]
MDSKALQELLTTLIARWENEVVEFKRAGDGFSTDEIGKYFSALANEANLRDHDRAWLVFGVDNKTRKVVGTDYRPEPARLQSLKMQMAEATEPSITLRNIHELAHPAGRVLLLEIPAAPLGLPVAWKGHYYARAGESLTSLGLDKFDEIRRQTGNTDWSAQAVPGATLAHMDDTALAQARESFAKKYANRFPAEEIGRWSNGVFLDRARLTRDGQIVRATLLLLGKAEAAHLLSPHPAQMTWKLEGQERAYEHFGLPFLLTSSALYRKVRNIQVRILPDDQLVAVEVAKYDRKIVLEALHNCIAHQDYGRNGRIVVTELPDRLVLENEGSFFEGRPEDYIAGARTPRRYRNPFLAQAMAELNMIDTMGYGIHEMHIGQARRYFPMPDYDLSEPQAVKMTIHGRVVDPAYSRLLIQKTDLPLEDILALDRVQKKLPLNDEGVLRHLRKAGLIEGRKPNFHVSATVAEATGSKAEYIRTRGFDDAHYKKMILELLGKFGSASRQEIDRLLAGKLSDALNDEQKLNKISNLLSNLRRAKRIRNAGSRKAPVWVLAE